MACEPEASSYTLDDGTVIAPAVIRAYRLDQTGWTEHPIPYHAKPRGVRFWQGELFIDFYTPLNPERFTFERFLVVHRGQPAQTVDVSSETRVKHIASCVSDKALLADTHVFVEVVD